MSASESAPRIRIPILVWRGLVSELTLRGRGNGEAGAFLLGSMTGSSGRVEAIVYYDDLDDQALLTGGITLHGSGYAKLYETCRERNLEVLADIHTHPGRDIRQSSIDTRQPMMPQVGHTAMIAPRFGRTSKWGLHEVGVYEYLGNFKWRTHPPSDSPRRVGLCLC